MVCTCSTYFLSYRYFVRLWVKEHIVDENMFYTCNTPFLSKAFGKVYKM